MTQPEENLMKTQYPSLDHAYLNENYYAVGFGHILPEAFTVYVEQNRMLLEQLSAALKDGSVDRATALVHTIKGSSGSVGARAMEQLAEQFETAVEQQDHSAMANLAMEMLVEQENTVRAIEEEVHNIEKTLMP